MPSENTIDLALGPLSVRLASPQPLRFTGTELEGFVVPCREPDFVLQLEPRPRLIGPTFNTPVIETRNAQALNIHCVDGYSLRLNKQAQTGVVTFVEHTADRRDASRAPLYLLGALKALCAVLFVERGGFLLHASAVEQDDRAWVFVGQSGAGKSTVAAMFEPNAVLNDELVGFTVGESTNVWATPFSGTLNAPRRHRKVHFGGGFALTQTPKTFCEPLGVAQALRLLLSCVALPEGDSTLESLAFSHASLCAAQGGWSRLNFAKDNLAVRSVVSRVRLSQ